MDDPEPTDVSTGSLMKRAITRNTPIMVSSGVALSGVLMIGAWAWSRFEYVHDQVQRLEVQRAVLETRVEALTADLETRNETTNRRLDEILIEIRELRASVSGPRN